MASVSLLPQYRATPVTAAKTAPRIETTAVVVSARPNAEPASPSGCATSRMARVAMPRPPRTAKSENQARATVIGPHRTGPKYLVASRKAASDIAAPSVRPSSRAPVP